MGPLSMHANSCLPSPVMPHQKEGVRATSTSFSPLLGQPMQPFPRRTHTESSVWAPVWAACPAIAPLLRLTRAGRLEGFDLAQAQARHHHCVVRTQRLVREAGRCRAWLHRHPDERVHGLEGQGARLGDAVKPGGGAELALAAGVGKRMLARRMASLILQPRSRTWKRPGCQRGREGCQNGPVSFMR